MNGKLSDADARIQQRAKILAQREAEQEEKAKQQLKKHIDENDRLSTEILRRFRTTPRKRDETASIPPSLPYLGNRGLSGEVDCIYIEPNSLDVDQAQHDDETSLRYRRDLVLDELDVLIGIADALQVVIRTITQNPPLQPLPDCTAGNIVTSATVDCHWGTSKCHSRPSKNALSKNT